MSSSTRRIPPWRGGPVGTVDWSADSILIEVSHKSYGGRPYAGGRFTNLKSRLTYNPGLINVETNSQEVSMRKQWVILIKRRLGEVMNAKYNWILEHRGVRAGLNVLVFGFWLVTCAILLSL